MIRNYLWVSLLVLLHSSLSAGEVLVVPTYDQPRPPLAMFIDQQPRGIYPDLVREILTEAGLKPELVPIPPMRRRVGFENHLYSLSCCANPAWRQRPKEQEIQIFSKPFYWTRDIFIFPKGKSFSIEKLSQLSDKRVATIHGFDYRGSGYFGERQNYHNEQALMLSVVLGRNDVGIVNEDIFNAFADKDMLSVGPIHDEASLHFRIHRQRAELVEAINTAIDRVIQSGRREAIIQAYIGQKKTTSEKPEE